MTWLTWRQYRVAALCAVVALILYVLCIAFGSDYRSQSVTIITIKQLSEALTAEWSLLASIMIATFVGAPLLAREREQRTDYLTWTQSISRTCWLIIKLGLVVAGVIALGIVGDIIANWHFGLPTAPYYDGYITLIGARQMSGIWVRFMTTGPVAITLILFALLLGVVVGSFIKRTIGAMALTFILFLVCMIGLYNTFPYLMPPQTAYENRAISYPLPENALFIHEATVNGQGQEVRFNCIANPPQGMSADDCVNKFHTKMVYQPAENFVPLQWLTSGLLFALSIMLAIIIYFRVRSTLE